MFFCQIAFLGVPSEGLVDACCLGSGQAGFNRHLAILLAKASCLLCILVTVAPWIGFRPVSIEGVSILIPSLGTILDLQSTLSTCLVSLRHGHASNWVVQTRVKIGKPELSFWLPFQNQQTQHTPTREVPKCNSSHLKSCFTQQLSLARQGTAAAFGDGRNPADRGMDKTLMKNGIKH